jgi:hypothetical protein
MPKKDYVYDYDGFNRYIVSQYFKVIAFHELEEQYPTVIKRFEERSKKYNSEEYYVPKAAINIVELDIQNFVEKSKVKTLFKFLETMSEDIRVFIFEFTKSYYRPYRNNTYDFTESELVEDICLYNIKEDKVIGFLETRHIITDFRVSFQEPFIGYINTNDDYKRMGIAAFMMQVASFYLWLRKRRKLFSGTCLSDEMLATCRSLTKRTKWIQRHDYYNNYTKEQQERYVIKPIILNVKVETGDQILDF